MSEVSAFAEFHHLLSGHRPLPLSYRSIRASTAPRSQDSPARGNGWDARWLVLRTSASVGATAEPKVVATIATTTVAISIANSARTGRERVMRCLRALPQRVGARATVRRSQLPGCPGHRGSPVATSFEV